MLEVSDEVNFEVIEVATTVLFARFHLVTSQMAEGSREVFQVFSFVIQSRPSTLRMQGPRNR